MSANRREDWEDSIEAESAGESAGEFSRLTVALERSPVVEVPAGFAARVMERLPEAQRRSEPGRVGRTAGYASAGAIAAALILLVGSNPVEFVAGKGFAFIFEMMLVGELLAVGFWLGTRRDA